VRSANVKSIMRARMAMCRDKVRRAARQGGAGRGGAGRGGAGRGGAGRGGAGRGGAGRGVLPREDAGSGARCSRRTPIGACRPQARSSPAPALSCLPPKGFVAIDPDNVDGYINENGIGFTAADQLAYNRWLAAAGHELGLAVGLKNDVAQVADLAGDFDFFVNE
jgi:hypothetical protein